VDYYVVYYIGCAVLLVIVYYDIGGVVVFIDYITGYVWVYVVYYYTGYYYGV